MRLVLSLVLLMFHYCFPAYSNNISKEDAEHIKKMQNIAISFLWSLCWWNYKIHHKIKLAFQTSKKVQNVLKLKRTEENKFVLKTLNLYWTNRKILSYQIPGTLSRLQTNETKVHSYTTFTRSKSFFKLNWPKHKNSIPV